VSYIPAIKPAVPKPPAVRMTSEYWKLPLGRLRFTVPLLKVYTLAVIEFESG